MWFQWAEPATMGYLQVRVVLSVPKYIDKLLLCTLHTSQEQSELWGVVAGVDNLGAGKVMYEWLNRLDYSRRSSAWNGLTALVSQCGIHSGGRPWIWNMMSVMLLFSRILSSIQRHSIPASKLG